MPASTLNVHVSHYGHSEVYPEDTGSTVKWKKFEGLPQKCFFKGLINWLVLLMSF